MPRRRMLKRYTRPRAGAYVRSLATTNRRRAAAVKLRRLNANDPLSATSRFGSLLGKSLHCRLRYGDSNVTLSPNAAIASNYIFSANDVYNPDRSQTGHQPRGFDQLMALYDHFIVRGARISVTFSPQNSGRWNNSTTGNTSPSTSAYVWPYIVGIKISDDVTPSNTHIDLLESRYTTYTSMTNVSDGKKLEMNVNPLTFLGYPKKSSDDALKGGVASSPSEGCFFHVFSLLPDANDGTASIRATVTIDYYVEFIEPKNPSNS